MMPNPKQKWSWCVISAEKNYNFLQHLSRLRPSASVNLMRHVPGSCELPWSQVRIKPSYYFGLRRLEIQLTFTYLNMFSLALILPKPNLTLLKLVVVRREPRLV